MEFGPHARLFGYLFDLEEKDLKRLAEILNPVLREIGKSKKPFHELKHVLGSVVMHVPPELRAPAIFITGYIIGGSAAKTSMGVSLGINPDLLSVIEIDVLNKALEEEGIKYGDE